MTHGKKNPYIRTYIISDLLIQNVCCFSLLALKNKTVYHLCQYLTRWHWCHIDLHWLICCRWYEVIWHGHVNEQFYWTEVECGINTCLQFCSLGLVSQQLKTCLSEEMLSQKPWLTQLNSQSCGNQVDLYSLSRVISIVLLQIVLFQMLNLQQTALLN